MLDYIVYIGRFQPLHNGHLDVIRQAKEKAKKVIILVGGYNEPRSLRNPFTFKERLDFIDKLTFNQKTINQPIIKPINDYVYNEQRWLTEVRDTVSKAISCDIGWTDFPSKVGIVINDSDNSASYSMDFPEYKKVPIKDTGGLRATDIRKELFSGFWDYGYSKYIPKYIYSFLGCYVETDEWHELFKESQFIDNYKEPYANLPYAPTFNTVDAVVVQSGNILLVTRGGELGKGKLALAGGFVEAGETLAEATIRELREETRLKVAEPVLKGSIKSVKTYDSPYRSQLGRVITTVTHFELGSMPKLPKVQGADDAAKAHWYPLNEVNKSDMFDDHFHIIQDMLGV